MIDEFDLDQDGESKLSPLFCLLIIIVSPFIKTAASDSISSFFFKIIYLSIQTHIYFLVNEQEFIDIMTGETD